MHVFENDVQIKKKTVEDLLLWLNVRMHGQDTVQ